MPIQGAPSTTVRNVSECYVKPLGCETNPQLPAVPLSPWEYAMLSCHYIQKGLLFAKPPPSAGGHFSILSFLDKLKDSLSNTLVHFYPLAGRLVTVKTDDPPSYVVRVDCNSGPGARFVHSTVDLFVDDILKATYTPTVVQSFFDHARALNHDGHGSPLLTIKVTELIDGIFVGCSMNHSVGDGTAFWNFFNSLSTVFQALEEGNSDATTALKHLPVFDRSFLKEHLPLISLRYTSSIQFLRHFEPPLLKERIFHLSSESIAKLKSQVNSEQKTGISSLQAVSALVWRSVTRARHLPADQLTNCKLACNDRTRMVPPLSEKYFGSCSVLLKAYATTAELQGNSLGWVANKIHNVVIEHNAEKIREVLDWWMNSPVVFNVGKLCDPCGITMGSSPLFNKYGVQFGLGKALALRSGYANKFCGKVTSYPGRDDEGSMDLEICLQPDVMDALELDDEFMTYTTV